MSLSLPLPVSERQEEVQATSRKAADCANRAFRFAAWVEWIVAVLVILTAVALHYRFATRVGALWRDEVNSVNLASVRSLREFWHLLEFDSFPALYFGVLRLWIVIFGSGNDNAFRLLGFVVGLALLGALWLNARTFGSRFPLISLPLVALNTMIIRYGDSNRAYGLGMILIVLTAASYWRIVQANSATLFRTALTAGVCAILSVQCLYYNAVLLFAISIGAVVVLVQARKWHRAILVLALGAIAALSLVPYLPMIAHTRTWSFMVYYPASLSWLWHRAGEVMGSPRPVGVWIWPALVFFALSAALFSVIRRRATPATLFAAMTLIVGIAGYTTFLNVLNYYTQPWYYITLATFVAAHLEIIFGSSHNLAGLHRRYARCVVSLALLAIFGVPAWQQTPVRHTNIDVVAAELDQVVTPNDLILVAGWECAIPLVRYYRGDAELVTIPPINDHRLHRYDQVVAEFTSLDSFEPMLARIEQVLRSGRRIYCVGSLVPTTDVAPPPLRPIHRDPSGKWVGSGGVMWQLHAGYLLRTHAKRMAHCAIQIPGEAVQEFEQLDVSVFDGWRELN